MYSERRRFSFFYFEDVHGLTAAFAGNRFDYDAHAIRGLRHTATAQAVCMQQNVTKSVISGDEPITLAAIIPLKTAFNDVRLFCPR